MKEKLVIETAIESCSIKQMFCLKVLWNITVLHLREKTSKNKCKSAHLSAVTGLLPATLFKSSQCYTGHKVIIDTIIV